jgi:hypothetical protein
VPLVSQKKKIFEDLSKKAFQAFGHATAHVVSCQSLTTEAQVQFEASSVHMGFVVNTVELEQVFLPVLWLILSLLFHHCSILILSSPTTDAV